MPEPLSLLASGAAERALSTETFVRRLVKTTRLKPGAAVLQLGKGDGATALALAQQHQCKVLVIDSDAEALARLGDSLETWAEDPNQWKGSDTYALVLVTGPLTQGFKDAAERLRPLLGVDGRLCRIYPVKVGLGKAPADWQAAWQEQLGEPLQSPAALLGVLEANGFEPEGVETLSDEELAVIWQAGAPTPGEQVLFATAEGKPAASCAVIIGRRKEVGEKPPVSADRG